MSRLRKTKTALGCTALVLAVLLAGADSAHVKEDELWRHRNLGKAFYENPTTQIQAVDEFKKALDLAPNSARERLNYGLALLRAAKTKEGAAEFEKAIAQLQRMTQLAPDEPKSHYNLAVLYKLNGKLDAALKEFEISAKLDP